MGDSILPKLLALVYIVAMYVVASYLNITLNSVRLFVLLENLGKIVNLIAFN